MKNSITTRGMDIGSTRLAAEPVRRHSGLLGRIASFTRGVRSGVLALGLSAGAVSTLASCVPGEVGLQAAVAQPDLTKNTPADAGADLSGTKDAMVATLDGGDMSMIEDAVMTLDAQEGDMTGESDMADNDASVNTDGGEVDMANNDGGVQADGNVTDGGVDAGSMDANVQDLVYTDMVSVADLARPDMFNFMNCLHTGSDNNFTDNGGHIDKNCKGAALICECPNDPQKDAGTYIVHACANECAP